MRLLGFARVDTFLGALVGDHRLVPHASCGCWSRVHLSLESSSNKQGSEDRFSFVLVLVSQGHVLLSSTPCRMDAFKGGYLYTPQYPPLRKSDGQRLLSFQCPPLCFGSYETLVWEGKRIPKGWPVFDPNDGLGLLHEKIWIIHSAMGRLGEATYKRRACIERLLGMCKWRDLCDSVRPACRRLSARRGSVKTPMVGLET